MKKTKDITTKKGRMTYWRISDIEFDEEGCIVIKQPKVAALLKRHIKRGKHIYLSSTNSGNYCVPISNCT